MDPITAALLLALEVVKLIELIIDKTPPAQQAEFAEQAAKDLRMWHDLIDKLTKGHL